MGRLILVIVGISQRLGFVWDQAEVGGGGTERHAHSRIIGGDYLVWLTRNSNIVRRYVQWQVISRPFS